MAIMGITIHGGKVSYFAFDEIKLKDRSRVTKIPLTTLLCYGICIVMLIRQNVINRVTKYSPANIQLHCTKVISNGISQCCSNGWDNLVVEATCR